MDCEIIDGALPHGGDGRVITRLGVDSDAFERRVEPGTCSSG